ncbi:hypothetical protein [Bartonella ancashensis]|uniref:Phage protein n=1 Tax=Bartonella ancashensis TaxID=1318743 RepID=A0A0M3T2N9_9HYPH|nr:hypothetical protein [Bartonella ancashensis]ALE03065.1 Phage protein [Bartonella ancashensis]
MDCKNYQERYSLHLTNQWSWEEMKPYKNDINKAINKYTKRFSDDLCLKTMAQEIINGQTQLWLILKNEIDFSAFAVTKIDRTYTGKKRVVLLDLAGEGGPKLAHLIDKLEEWARTIKADEILTMGRMGWAKMLKYHGYTPDFIHYRKVLT